MKIRISQDVLPNSYFDGQVLTAEILNSIVGLLREGVNNNYDDLIKIISGGNKTYTFNSIDDLDNEALYPDAEDGDFGIVFDYSEGENNDVEALLIYQYDNGVFVEYDSSELSLVDFLTRIKAVEASNTTIAGDLSTLNSKVTTAEGEIDTLQTDVDNLETAVGNIEDDVEELFDTAVEVFINAVPPSNPNNGNVWFNTILGKMFTFYVDEDDEEGQGQWVESNSDQVLNFNIPEGTGTVTSVGLTMPTGFTVVDSPVTGSGTIGVSLTGGYVVPTTTNASTWDGKANNFEFTSTLDKDSWTLSDSIYNQELIISGILETDKPIVDVNYATVITANIATTTTDWSKVYRGVSAAGKITFYATEEPTINIPLNIKVVR
jgi:hypothetical protein